MDNRWQQMYQAKLRTPDDATAMIRDGEVISTALSNGQPVGLYEAIVKRVKERKLHKPTILAASLAAGMSLMDPEIKDKIEYDSLFVWEERERIKEGYFTYSPVKLGDLQRISIQGLRPVQVALLRVSPMDRHGFFSLGVNVDIGWDMAKSNPHRRLLIVEVNRYMPRTHGNNQVHISEVDVITEHHIPLVEEPTPPMKKEWEMIGQYVAEMVPDGATLQLGVGGIPGAVGRYLMDKRELGVHSEVISDVFLDLYEAGVITCTKKTFMPHKWVGAFVEGTQKIYDFVHENPLVEMHGCGMVNNPYVIAQHENMISVNATLQVDLTGQCASESIGPVQYSSTGGQLDFVQGAWMSKGGKSFICTESVVVNKKGERKSKIVPQLYPGSFVTTPRTEVHWVVTEYGAVLLKGQSIKSRVESIISIAHPDFRDELRYAAKKMNLVR
ncbi:MAG: acetyl-CoA hydrolase/transferase family protein [Syntrophomonadales bacterium]|jgi:4-hydroxybutyrate CoA-transferase